METYCDPTALAALYLPHAASASVMAARRASDLTWHTSSLAVAQVEFLLWRSGKGRALLPMWRGHLAESIYEAVFLSGWDDSFRWTMEANRSRQQFALNPALIAHTHMAAANGFKRYFSADPSARGLAQKLGLIVLPERLV